MLSENVKIFPVNFIFTFHNSLIPKNQEKKIFRDPQVQNISIYGALMALLFFRIEGDSKLSPFFTFLKF